MNIKYLPTICQIQVFQSCALQNQIVQRMAAAFSERRIAHINVRHNKLGILHERFECQPQADAVRTIVAHIEPRSASENDILDGCQSGQRVFLTLVAVPSPAFLGRCEWRCHAYESILRNIYSEMLIPTSIFRL